VDNIELKRKKLTEYIFPTDQTPIEVEETAERVAEHIDNILTEINEFAWSKCWLIGKILRKAIEACKPKTEKEFLIQVSVSISHPISWNTLKMYLWFYDRSIQFVDSPYWEKVSWSVRRQICFCKGSDEEKKNLLKLAALNNWSIGDLHEFLRGKRKGWGRSPPKCFVCDELLDWNSKGKWWRYVPICHPCEVELEYEKDKGSTEA